MSRNSSSGESPTLIQCSVRSSTTTASSVVAIALHSNLIVLRHRERGTGNIVSPHATAEAVMPAILFLSGAMVLVALSFVILGVETHGVPMALDSDEDLVAGIQADT